MVHTSEQNRKYREDHKEYFKKYKKEWAKRNRERIRIIQKRSYDPVKAKCRSAVGWAIRSGKLIKPKICSKCKAKATIEAHHVDYAQPFLIAWLCVKCHGETRKK